MQLLMGHRRLMTLRGQHHLHQLHTQLGHLLLPPHGQVAQAVAAVVNGVAGLWQPLWLILRQMLRPKVLIMVKLTHRSGSLVTTTEEQPSFLPLKNLISRPLSPLIET